MRHPLMLASTLLALTGVGFPVLIVPTTALAQQQAQYACYVPGSGTVYRVKESKTPAQCSAGHVEFQIVVEAALTTKAAAGDAQKKPGGGGGGPTSEAGGDLAGSYPNPSVVRIQSQPVSATAPSAGQILTFSNGAWGPQAPASAALPVNAAGALDLSNQSGLVSVGTLGVGSIPVSGAGTRFMWYPAKRALRAGNVSGLHWDVPSIGDGSVAIGTNTVASGSHTVALGFGTQATGHQSVALGINTTASGDAALATGSGSTASAIFASALGVNTNATANAATAMGSGTTASGIQSTAMGSGTTASGLRSTAFGQNTTASGESSTAMGRWASTNGKIGAFVYGDASSVSNAMAVADNQFVVRAQRVWLGTNNTVTANVGRFLETSTGAYLTTGGTWTNSSDVNRKHEFRNVDGEDVLATLATMPVTTWSYRSEDSTVRHMGPTAQDFRAAFGLGDTDKAIATVDADGVSLAALKALVQRTTVLRTENDELRAALADLSRRLARLESGQR